MSSGQAGKIKFSNKIREAHFYTPGDNLTNMNVSDDNSNSQLSSYKVKELGRGGTAKIYKIPAGAFPAPVAMKRYKDKLVSNEGSAVEAFLRSLIEFRKKLSDENRNILDQYTIWPQRLVFDSETDRVCGFVMHLIPELFFTKISVAGEEEKIESNLDFVLHGDEYRRKRNLPVLTAKGRAKIIYNLIQVVSVIHSHDYVLGDLSPSNILIHVDNVNQGKNRILFIDTDSFRKKGGTHPLKQFHTPEWVPPECLKADAELKSLTPNANPHKRRQLEIDTVMQNQGTDIYKICLAIIRLYHKGEKASSITVSQAAQERLRTEIGDDFCSMVIRGLSESNEERPIADAFLTCLVNSLQAKKASAGA